MRSNLFLYFQVLQMMLVDSYCQKPKPLILNNISGVRATPEITVITEQTEPLLSSSLGDTCWTDRQQRLSCGSTKTPQDTVTERLRQVSVSHMTQQFEKLEKAKERSPVLALIRHCHGKLEKKFPERDNS